MNLINLMLKVSSILSGVFIFFSGVIWLMCENIVSVAMIVCEIIMPNFVVKMIRFYTTFLGKAFSYLFVGLSQLMPFGNKKAYYNHKGDDMNFYFLAAALYDILLAFVMIAAFFIDKCGIYPLSMSKNFFTESDGISLFKKDDEESKAGSESSSSSSSSDSDSDLDPDNRNIIKKKPKKSKKPRFFRRGK